jgi:hypothetical protein
MKQGLEPGAHRKAQLSKAAAAKSAAKSAEERVEAAEKAAASHPGFADPSL